MTPAKIGEFEMLVLPAILRQEGEAYANRIRDDLQEKAGRTATRGAVSDAEPADGEGAGRMGSGERDAEARRASDGSTGGD